MRSRQLELLSKLLSIDKRLLAIWFENCRRPASNRLRTSFEPASVIEFGFYLNNELCKLFNDRAIAGLIT